MSNFISSLKESQDSLHASSWNLLSHIYKNNELCFSGDEFDKSLPDKVEGVTLSFHRLLPSVGSLIFEFNLDDSVSKDLRRVKNKEYLGPVVFKNFWPVKNITRGYSFGFGNEGAAEAIRKERDSVRAILEKWVSDKFHWKSDVLASGSYIDVYEITGNPKDFNERKKWIEENSNWLEEYGFNTRGFNIYAGEDILLSSPRECDNKFYVSNVIAKMDSNGESDFGDHFGFKLQAIANSTTIFSVIDKYRRKVESLRGYGFKNLHKRGKISKKSQINAQELKRTIVVVSRLKHEIESSSQFISLTISEVGKLVELFKGEAYNLGVNSIENSKCQLKIIKDAADIIDAGLTSHLSSQSIYVMYKLQRRMFFLTLVVTLATIVGVISEWEKLKMLYQAILASRVVL